MRDPNDVDAEPQTGQSPPDPFGQTTNAFPRNATVEEFQVSANTVLARLKSLLRQGNVRTIVIKTEEGKPLVTLPLTVGVAGGAVGLLMGPLFTVGVMAVTLLAARLTISIEKSVD